MTEDSEEDVLLEPGVVSWCWFTSTFIPPQLTLIRLWLVVLELSVVPFLLQSDSFLSSLSPHLSLGMGDADVLELGLPVRGVNGWQVALGTRKPDFSPPDEDESFLSEGLE